MWRETSDSEMLSAVKMCTSGQVKVQSQQQKQHNNNNNWSNEYKNYNAHRPHLQK